jgi:hypothetical protein
MKRGKHRPAPPVSTHVLAVLGLLALLEWTPERVETKG